MPAERIFLGWDKPILELAIDQLIAHHAKGDSLDLSQLVLVLTGRRAGRRLLELLVRRCADQRLLLVPPLITTEHGLDRVFYTPRKPIAGLIACRFAWCLAFQACDAAILKALLPTPPARDDTIGWMLLARRLGDGIWRELAGEGLDFEVVQERIKGQDGQLADSRWQALAAAHAQYLKILAEWQFADSQMERRSAIDEQRCATDKTIVLLGVVDLAKSIRQMVEQSTGHVVSFVAAPRSLSSHFDSIGCLNVRAWCDADLAIPEEAICTADDFNDQARAALELIAEQNGKSSASEITIGVPDERVAPAIHNFLERVGLTGRWYEGTPISRAAPLEFLRAAAEYLAGRDFAKLCSLMRHPQFLAAFENQIRIQREESQNEGAGEEDTLVFDWLTWLDDYQSEHLPAEVPAQWRGTFQNAGQELAEALQFLMAPLLEPHKTFGDWQNGIQQSIQFVFGNRTYDRSVPDDRLTLGACDAIKESLDEFRALDEKLNREFTLSEVVSLLLDATAETFVAPEPIGDSIEMLGWLELAMDDAPVMIVSGFNEGFVPNSIDADAFLPDSLRAELGLLDNDRRYARDAYLTSTILASRPVTRLIVGRRAAEGDPLTPSRLLFACEPKVAAERVLKLFGNDSARVRRPLSGTANALTSAAGTDTSSYPRRLPAPIKPAKPIDRLSVTAFREYINCPYQFYLRYIEKLSSSSDGAEELQGMGFGMLAHLVLAAFARDAEIKDSQDARAITDYLQSRLSGFAMYYFGKEGLPVIRIQIEQLRTRLDAFAKWQANWAARGYRIVASEVGAKEGTLFPVDGQPFYLIGRIDRIDQHSATGETIIFDYKTSDTAKTPEQTHLRSKEWVDLQLPLYRHICPKNLTSGEIKMAYIRLPKDISHTGEAIASWSPEQLSTADSLARDIIRGIRRGEFEPSDKKLTSEDYESLLKVRD